MNDGRRLGRIGVIALLAVTVLAAAACEMPINPIPPTLWNPVNYASGINHVHIEALPAMPSVPEIPVTPIRPVVAGATFDYDQTDAIISVNGETAGEIGIDIDSDAHWAIGISGSAGVALVPGLYSPAHRQVLRATPPTIEVQEFHTFSCEEGTGWFAIDAISFAGAHGSLSGLDLRFDQRCTISQGQPSHQEIRGTFHWRSTDTTAPPGPVYPPPGKLWRAPAAQLPAAGNYVFIQNDADPQGNPIGNQTATQVNAVLAVTEDDYPTRGQIRIDVADDNPFTASIVAPEGQVLRPGYYPNLGENRTRAQGGVSPWQTCGTDWFVIDSIARDGDGRVTSLDLRMHDRCISGGAQREVQVHWRNDDPTIPPGPSSIPAGLWTPPTGSLPTRGSYVYLQSDLGDPVGKGATSLYTEPTDRIHVTAALDGHRLTISFDGPGSGPYSFFTGEFLAPAPSDRPLTVGYYGPIQRFPFGNPARPREAWYSTSVGCETVSGWFTIDDIAYAPDGVTLQRLTLRLEQHCDGIATPLHVLVHWSGF